SADHATFTVGSPGSFTVTTSGFPVPSLTKVGSLPSGITFVDNGDGTATLAGTPAAGGGGVRGLTITAANGVSPDATQSFTLTVNEAPAITSSGAATFAVGAASSFLVTTSGFPVPALSVTGSLPTGVVFQDNHDSTATLGGTPAPASGGVYSFTITAHNGVGTDGTQAFTLTVDQSPAITSAGQATFTVGAAGSLTVTSVGPPPPSLSESGALPG